VTAVSHGGELEVVGGCQAPPITWRSRYREGREEQGFSKIVWSTAVADLRLAVSDVKTQNKLQ
jgi:hypothetical protein